MNALRSVTHIFLLFILVLAVVFVGAAQTSPPATPDSGTAAAAAAGAPADQQSSGAPTTDQKMQQLQKDVDQLNQKVKDMEQKAELKKVEDAAAAEKAKTEATVTADTSGFTIVSPHGNFLLKIGADLQMDNRTFLGVNSTNPTDLLTLRRVRPTFSGTVYKYVDYFFRPDFGQGSVVIYDAYLELKYFNFAKVRAGKFKPPVGLERLQSDDDTTFVERGMPTLLVASRDIGYQISGDIVPKHINYAVGVFNGVPDNSLSDTSASSHRDFAARLFFNPLNPEVANLGFGIGASSGSVDGESLPSYKSFGQNSFFTFNSGVIEAGHRTRLAPGAYYYMGGFGLYSEYGLTEEDLQKGTTRADVGFRAYQVAASYILTGEKKGYTSPTPKKNFDPKNHGYGAWELAIRTGEFTADRGLFNYGFATSTSSPRTAHEVVGGVNWYLNRLVRISGDYGRTNFGGGATVAAGINRPTEKVIILRLQINFI
jgi:phosphate-selective porin OprO/OprP